MDKRNSVIESIQKLLALNVSDSEIADNLVDVGISKEEATSLIIEAKGVVETPIQTQGTFTVPSVSQNNSFSPNQNSTIKIKSPPTQKQNFSNLNPNSNQQSSKAVFDETVTKLSMNDEVISQIPFEKQGVEKKISLKNDSAQREAVEKKIIIDVANQSNPDEVGQDIKDESSDDLKGAMDEEDSAELDASGQIKTISINDEESEDEFENKVKQTLASVKRDRGDMKEKNEIPIINLDKSSQNVSSLNNSTQKNVSPKMSVSPSFDFDELWKKGIVIAVNTKLSEMKQLKDDVDLEINQKVGEAVRKELYQFKILNDSQKDLFISSNKEALDQKQKEITFIIDSKIAELKQYNKQLTETLNLIDVLKKQQESYLSETKTALEEAKKTKSQLIVEVNSEMIKTKSQAQAFLDSSSQQLAQMDERINKTLELEKNIAEGLLAQAEQKIEHLAINRADELISKMEIELNKLQSASKKISPELLDQKIQTIEKFKLEFINSMQTNLAQMNSAIEELNKKNELAQSTFEEKTLAIDAKMEELTKFENRFTQMMDTILEKS